MGTREDVGERKLYPSGQKLLEFPNLRFVTVDDQIIAKSQSLVKEYRIRPRDAIHCACALTKGINQIISNDRDFDTVQELTRLPIDKV